MIRAIYFPLFSAGLFLVVAQESKDFLVKAPIGPIKGFRSASYEGRKIIAFEGVPFAKPPVDDLRFKEPVPMPPWNTTVEANKNYICMQFDKATNTVIGTEDCLYLYIYVPRDEIKADEGLPVVVNIHGGGFSNGDPKSFSGPDYIMDRDIIYVTMNYRVGILGFLSTDDAVVSGNNGLKDQALALLWIKTNIASFGGNPYSITLTGASAGGVSVHLHYMSPLSTGLFNRGISHSGTALNTWALTKTPYENFRKLSADLNCTSFFSHEAVDCLKKLPVRSVVEAIRKFYVFENVLPTTPFGPVIEFYRFGSFLPDHPYKLMLEGRLNDCPWVTSNTKDEGLPFIGRLITSNKLEELDKRWDELSPYFLGYNESVFDVDKKPIGKLVRDHYLKNNTLSSENSKDIIRLITDRNYIVDAITAVCLQATVARFPVYYYLFEYETKIPSSSRGSLSGAGHGDDVKLLYKAQSNPAKLSDGDEKMKNIFVDFLYEYSNIAIPSFKGILWKPIKSIGDSMSYMHIISPGTIKREKSLNLEPFLFWKSLPLGENEQLFQYVLKIVHYLPTFF